MYLCCVIKNKYARNYVSYKYDIFITIYSSTDFSKFSFYNTFPLNDLSEKA